MNPYFIIGIIVVLFAFLVAVALLEKRMVWPYGEPQDQPHFGDESGYGLRVIGEAVTAGFTMLGWVPDLKGVKYKASYALLVSPARDCFVVVGVGKIWNMSLQGTWMHTPTIDSRSFYSADNQTCVEIDVSRSWKSQLVITNSFGQLWERHREWLKSRKITPRLFHNGREIEEFRLFREEHFRLMSQWKLIRYITPSATHWRYTFYGAIKLVALNYSIGLLRAMSSGRIPRTA